MYPVANSITSNFNVSHQLSDTRASFENLYNVSKKIGASESGIGDADIAAEVSNMLKNRILKQAGVSLQAQANQRVGSLLALLR